MIKIKRIISFILSLTIIYSAFPVTAQTDYDEEGAYNECYTLYPDFINKIKDLGITDNQLMTFVKSVESEVLEQNVELTEENFDDLMFVAFKEAFRARKNLKVRDALAKAYPESVTAAMDGIITEEFMPIYITVKRFLFGITTPVITLSGAKTEVLVHHVHMPEDARIYVGFFDSDGTLLHAHIDPTEPLSCNCENVSYAKAFAFKGNSLAPLCDSYILKF
ncbi:MAG: hypothetical protein IJ435_06555 [Clostridia bacterium]|nr:hypothetical protein [Clostridia bacterium]